MSTRSRGSIGPKRWNSTTRSHSRSETWGGFRAAPVARPAACISIESLECKTRIAFSSSRREVFFCGKIHSSFERDQLHSMASPSREVMQGTTREILSRMTGDREHAMGRARRALPIRVTPASSVARPTMLRVGREVFDRAHGRPAWPWLPARVAGRRVREAPSERAPGQPSMRRSRGFSPKGRPRRVPISPAVHWASPPCAASEAAAGGFQPIVGPCARERSCPKTTSFEFASP